MAIRPVKGGSASEVVHFNIFNLKLEPGQVARDSYIGQRYPNHRCPNAAAHYKFLERFLKCCCPGCVPDQLNQNTCRWDLDISIFKSPGDFNVQASLRPISPRNGHTGAHGHIHRGRLNPTCTTRKGGFHSRSGNVTHTATDVNDEIHTDQHG